MDTLEHTVDGLEVGSYRHSIVLATSYVVAALQSRGYDSELIDYVRRAVNEAYHTQVAVTDRALFWLVDWVGTDLSEGTCDYSSQYAVINALEAFYGEGTGPVDELKLALECVYSWDLPEVVTIGHRAIAAVLSCAAPVGGIRTPTVTWELLLDCVNQTNPAYLDNVYTTLVSDALQEAGVPEDAEIIKLVRFAVYYCAEYHTYTPGHYGYRAIYDLVYVVGSRLLSGDYPRVAREEVLKVVENYLHEEGCDETYIMRAVNEIRGASEGVEGTLKEAAINRLVALMTAEEPQ